MRRTLLTRTRLSRFASSSASVPSPEWVRPYLDLSDLAARSHRDLRPSPWLGQVVALVAAGSPSLASDLTAFCRKFLICLSPDFVSHVLRSPNLRGDPSSALTFFRWAEKQRNYGGHKLESFVSLVDIFSTSSDAREQKQGRVRNLFAEIRNRGDFLRNASAANSLIKGLGSLGMVEELLWVWRRMKETGLEPSLFSYNCLMDGLVNSMFVESAEKVFEAMQGRNEVSPDVVTYNILIKGYCKARKTQLAIGKFHEMEAKNIKPDKITYMTLMQSYYSERNFEACLRLYHEMEEKGLEIPPHAYSLVIGGLCKDGKPLEGLHILDDLTKRKCKGNVAIYTVLIDSFAKIGNEEQAMNLFERMKDKGFEPDAITYGVVINCLCKSGKMEKAMEWFEFCRGSGMALNAVFYSTLIDGFGKAGMGDVAHKLFEEMLEKGFLPDVYCYNALIDAFSKCGKIDEALELYKKMESEGCDQTIYTYTMLIDGLFRKHKNEEALKLWDTMIDKGITPTITSFRVLSTGLCLSGKVSRACKILDELAPMGIIPETAHEDMINVLCKAGRIKHACQLADGIVDDGREIPGKVRTIFINALRKAGNADLAIKLLHSKIGIGYDRFGGIKRRVKFKTLLA